jgi:hypothetical protein
MTDAYTLGYKVLDCILLTDYIKFMFYAGHVYFDKIRHVCQISSKMPIIFKHGNNNLFMLISL